MRAVLLLFLACFAFPVRASGIFIPTGGPADIAPEGYVAFCRVFPSECRPAGKRLEAIQLTRKRRLELQNVWSAIVDRIRPMTDQELYGVPEKWTFPQGAGDCEDYALLARNELMARGWPSSVLLLTLVWDEDEQAHIVLDVRTSAGDLILDNKSSRKIFSWYQTPYQYASQQSQRDPNRWVEITSPSPPGKRILVSAR